MTQITIQSLIISLLKSGKSAKETLATVKRVFPNCQTSLKCVYYYSSQLKKAGQFEGLKKSQVVNEEELAKALKGIKVA